MSFYTIFECVISWVATQKMLVINVAANQINNTTSWLAYASWTWEVLRRNPDYISYYKSLKNKGLETHMIGDDTPLIIASQGYPSAKKMGLLFPADPELGAGLGHAMWHPDVMKSAVRFHVIPRHEVDRRDKPFQLSKFPAHQTHFLDANGTYHIRFLGRNFWFQMQCDGQSEINPNAYIGFENNRVENYDRRLKTQGQIYGVYDGSIALDSRLHLPANLTSHQKSMIAYDIQSRGGSLTDIVSALFEAKLIVKNPDEFKDFSYDAKNALNRAKAFIYGDYLKILDKQ